MGIASLSSPIPHYQAWQNIAFYRRAPRTKPTIRAVPAVLPPPSGSFPEAERAPSSRNLRHRSGNQQQAPDDNGEKVVPIVPVLSPGSTSSTTPFRGCELRLIGEFGDLQGRVNEILPQSAADSSRFSATANGEAGADAVETSPTCTPGTMRRNRT